MRQRAGFRTRTGSRSCSSRFLGSVSPCQTPPPLSFRQGWSPLRVPSISPLEAACYTFGGAERGLVLRYHFGDCVLDTSRRELSRQSSFVAVEPQVFDLLVHLIRHRERVLTKDDLLAALWHG